MASIQTYLKTALVAILIGSFLTSTTLSSLMSTSVIRSYGKVQQALASDLALTVDGFNLLDSDGNKVYLRGVGMAGFAPSLIFWGLGENDGWSHQWTPANDPDVAQTFQNLRDVWHVNMIRFFYFPEWWWLDYVTPSVASGYDVYGTEPVSTRNYIKTLATVAAKYGIYLDLVPYQLTAQAGAYASDPYLSDGWGLPLMNDWTDVQQSFINDQGFATERDFWHAFYTAMGNDLKDYNNVIFEAWNEPNKRPTYINVVPDGFLTYLTTMYNAIRGTGATNLIMMQWEVGWTPDIGMNLGWVKQINDALGTPSNVVYTTHFYYYSPSDLTRYWNQNDTYSYKGGIPKTVEQLESDLTKLVNSMNVTAPLVINEEGSCRSSSANVTNDYIWWRNVLQAQARLGIGMCAYYWLSDSGLGGAFSGLGLLSSGYSPNTMGQIYIDSYNRLP